MIKLKAIVIWAAESAGCIERPFSGIRPSVLVGGDLITSTILSEDGVALMPRCEECRVVIELPYGELYVDFLVAGLEFKIQVGAREIGVGRIVEVLK